MEYNKVLYTRVYRLYTRVYRVLVKLGSHRGDDRCRPTSSPTTSLVRMHRIRRPSSQNGRRNEKRLGDEYQTFLILVAQDSSLKAMRLIAAVGTKLKTLKHRPAFD